MGGLFWLTKAQMRLISPNFPRSHGVVRVDDRRVVSGIVFVLKSGLRWRDAPAAYGPHKTLYNRFIRWSRMGVFNRIFAALAEAAGAPETAMIASTHLKAHRTASSLLKKGLFPRCIGRTKGGLNSKLHAVCNDQGRPLILVLTEGQTSDYKGAALVFDYLPNTRLLSATRAMTQTGCARRSSPAALRPVSHPRPIESSRSPTTEPSTRPATRSRSCLGASRTGGASVPATIAAPTHSWPLSS
jgi:transposase